MQDGQFNIGPVTIGQPDISRASTAFGTPEYQPIEYTPFLPASVSGPFGIQANQDLYEDIKISDQSGLKNWWNTFLKSWNETQVGVGASDLMDGLVKKANLQTEINQLDADFTMGKLDEMTYLTKKNELFDSLNGAYSTIKDARASMYEDRQDQARRPVSKAFEQSTQLSLLRGSNASFGETLKYQLPSIAGSSFALLGATLTSAFGMKVAKNIATRAAAGSAVPGVGNAVGFISGLATVFGVNAYARNLESKAEVGSQFLLDYDDLKGEYLKDKPAGYQLSEEEENAIVIKAAAGSETQYWKNMSLAVSDSIQSLILAGSFSSMLSKFRNLNLFTRLAVPAVGLYATKKLEGLEEGLQYAFSTEKSLASRGIKTNESFAKSLFQDYKDVLGSMNFFGNTGGGIYENDPEFKANVHGGELLGMFFGGTRLALDISKDVNSYRAATKQLEALNPTKTDAPLLRFKDDLYAQFFGPKNRGVLGLFSEDSESRVFFLKQALTTLNKKRTEDGKRLLTDQELSKELSDIDQAFSTFQSINKNLDSILSPFGRKNKALTALQKRTFRDQLFHNTMQLQRLQAEKDAKEATMVNTMDTHTFENSELVDITARLDVINQRLKNSFGNYETFLTQEKTKLEETLNELYPGKKPDVPSIPQDVYKAVNDYYDVSETQFDYQKKRDTLSKVKSWQGLQAWSKTYMKEAVTSELKEQEDAILEDNKAFAETIVRNKPYGELTPDEKKARTSENKTILEKAGFGKTYIDTLTEDDLELQASKALEDFRNKVALVTDDQLLSVLSEMDSKDNLDVFLSRPAIRAAFNRLGFDINADIDTIKKLAIDKIKTLLEERRESKIRTARPPELESKGKTIAARVKSENDLRETEEYNRQFNIVNGKAKQRDVLQAIIDSPYATEPEKALAAEYLKVSGEEEIEFGQNWRTNASGQQVRRAGTTAITGTDTKITIDLDHFTDSIVGNQAKAGAPAFETIILHEVTHRLTHNALQQSPEFQAELREIANKAREAARKEGNVYYGLSERDGEVILDELLAEAMTSPGFQKLLTNIEGKGKKTLWEDFINAIISAFKRVFNIEVSGTALEDVISIVSSLSGAKRNVVQVTENLKNKVDLTLGEIKPEEKDAKQKLNEANSTLYKEIISTINELELGEVVKADLLSYLSDKVKALEDQIKQFRKDDKIVEFQGRTFEKGQYVVLAGYPDAWYVEDADDTGLKLGRTEDNKVFRTTANDVNAVQFQGEKENAEYFIQQRDKPEDEDIFVPSVLFKSAGQQFEKKAGKYTEPVDPVEKRFYSFLSVLAKLDLSKSPYFALVIKDEDSYNGVPIPRTEETRQYLEGGGKRGEIAIIVDATGTPILFNDNGTPSNQGQPIVFNIETPTKIIKRDSQKLATSLGITLAEANKLKTQAAEKVKAARESAANGKPVLIRFKGVSPGVTFKDILDQVESSPISPEDSQRVVDLMNYLGTNKNQAVKDFLFSFIIPINPEYKISGGRLMRNGVQVTPTTDVISGNFIYKKDYNLTKENAPYTLYSLVNGVAVIDKTYPTYQDFLKTVTNLGSDITQENYNRYLSYEFGEVFKPNKDTTKSADPLPKVDPFAGGSLFDVELDYKPEYSNELGLFDNQTTFQLVKSIDKGIHNYLWKGGEAGLMKTIAGALQDKDFIDKALEITKTNLLARLDQLRNTRRDQYEAGTIKEAFYSAELDKIANKIDKITNNWKDIVNYYLQNSYVFSFSKDISYKYDESGNIIQEGDDRVAKEKGFDISNTVSPIDGASKEIKALVRGLSRFKRVGDKWVKVSNGFNVPDLANFAVTWNNLIKNLKETSSFEEMLQKLDDLQSQFPEYTELLPSLRLYYARAQAGDFESKLMVAKFYRDFINPEIPVFEILTSIVPGTTTFKVDEATRKNIKDLKQVFFENFRTKSPFRAKTNLGDVALSMQVLDLPTNTREERIKFFEALGFEFSTETRLDPEFEELTSAAVVRFFKNEIRQINAAKVVIKDPITQLSRQTAYNQGLGKRINDIINLESKNTTSAPSLSMQNVEDNTEYAISRPNFYTLVIKALNDSKRYPTFQSLVSEPQYAFLDKPYARTSHVLNMMFVLDSDANYGRRRLFNKKPVTLQLTNISGLKVEGSEGKKTTSLFIGDKVVVDFNQLLKTGFKELARAGDKSSAFGLKVSRFLQPGSKLGLLPISNFELFKGPTGYGGQHMFSIMEKYLKGEVVRLFLGRKSYLDNLEKMNDPRTQLITRVSLFDELLTQDLKQELYARVDAFADLQPNTNELYTKAEELAKEFISRNDVMRSIMTFFRNEVVAKQASLNKYGFNFKDPFWLDNTLRQYEPAQLLKAYVVNEFILHVEQTKLFNGDLVFYSTKDGEFHKRNPASGATGVVPITDAWWVEALNNDPNTNLQAKRLGLNNAYSNVVKTTVFREFVPKSAYLSNWRAQLKSQGLTDDQISRVVDPYEQNKEADAQGWITLDFYRSFKLSIGAWTIEQENVFERASTGQALSADEVEKLGRLFPPIKAQYSGPVHHEFYHVPAFHKFSLMPLIPAAIKGTNLEKLNERMLRNNSGYTLMYSGSKVGTISNDGLEPFYTKGRDVADPTTVFKNDNLIFMHYLKEQVQVDPELHDKVIYGTQFRKLLFQNIYSGGKEVNKKFAALEREYSDVIEQLTEFAKMNLVSDMGVEPVFKDGQAVDYVVKDQEKLVKQLREEVRKRKLNNNIKDFFETQDGKLKNPLDASQNHQQIRNMIMSMVNNRLVRQTIKGDMLIQGASTGYEKFVRPTDQDVLEYGTNGLRFYHVKDGKVRKMQVKVALTGDFKNLLYLNFNGERIQTLDRLNEALKDSKWMKENEKAVTMIGYRIPTQGLNSIEVMEVAEFLPPEAGNILIVPTEIVTKSGSDFDIDKLSIFKPNISYNENTGEAKYIPMPKTRMTFSKANERAIVKIKANGLIEELKKQKKAFKLFLDLNSDEQEEFAAELKTALNIVDPTLIQQLADSGARLSELDSKIAEFERDIRNTQIQLKANFSAEDYETLVVQRINLSNAKLELSVELDNVGQLKKRLLLQTIAEEDLKKSEDLLNAIYDKVFGEEVKFNQTINAKIDQVLKDKQEALDLIASYRDGLYNRIIEIATERLTDVDSFIQLITPNSTDLIKPTIQSIQGEKKSYLHTTNLTSSSQEEKYLAGIPNKKALGIAAVANTFSQLFNKVGLKINKKFKGRPVFHPMLKTETFDMGDMFLENGVLKAEIESQMINAYVDVLNDDFISKANLSLDTAGAFFYLLHLGHDSDQLIYFFSHPVIKAYVGSVANSRSLILYDHLIKRGYAEEAARLKSDEYDEYYDAPPKTKSVIKFEVKMKLRRDAFVNLLSPTEKRGLKTLKKEGVATLHTNPKLLSKETLKDAVSKNISEFSFAERQAILGYYLTVMGESSELLKLQQINNYDTTTSVNPISHEYRELVKGDVSAGGLFQGDPTRITQETVIKPFNQYNLISKLFDVLMPVSLNADIRAKIADFLQEFKDQDVDVDKLTRTFINDWLYFLAVNYGQVNGQNFGVYGKNLLFKDQLVNELIGLKVDPKWDNLRKEFPIIDQFRAEVFSNIGNISLYREDNSSDYQNVLIEQFQNLAEFADPQYSAEDQTFIKNLFRNLAVLGFTQSGLNKSNISFTDIIPNDYFVPMMNDAIKTFTGLDTETKNEAFNTFSVKFVGENTQLFGKSPKTIPYWRFKDYTFTAAPQDVEAPKTGTIKDHKMSYKMPASQNIWGVDTTTVAEAESGRRTATTRSFALGNVGDVITFEGRPQQYRITGLEKLTPEKVGDPNWVKQWSDKEGWTIDHFRSVLGGSTVHVGSFQTSFERITTPANQLKSNEKGQYNIYAGSGENVMLSNFASRPFEIAGATYKTVEHAYQVMKFGFSAQNDANTLIASQIFSAPTAAKAKELGGKFIGLNKAEWDANSSQIMKELLLESFKQNPTALQALLSTGTAQLTHTQDRSKWKTEFPKLLMEVRSELGGTPPGSQLNMFDISLASEENSVSLDVGTYEALLKNLAQDGLITQKCG